MKDLAYKVVFDKIMEHLNAGVAPWRKPWSGSMPMNGKSKREYRGINYWLLTAMGFGDPRWFTFNQIKEMGGSVKKGEKSTPVVFWTWFEVEDKKNPKETKKVPYLKYYNVFNAEQVDGLTLDDLSYTTCHNNDKAKNLILDYSENDDLTIIDNKGMACYIPSKDQVWLPSIGKFDTPDNYYATAFHECIHSTGAEKRLNRKGVTDAVSFGSTNYSEEELVAEFGSAFLCHMCGIENTTPTSAAYISSWKKVLNSDPKVLVHAASSAQKAVDYILSKSNVELLANNEDNMEEEIFVA